MVALHLIISGWEGGCACPGRVCVTEKHVPLFKQISMG